MKDLANESSLIFQRLEKLENQNRRFKNAFAAVLVLASCAFFIGQASPSRTVEANEFVLKDQSGKARARLYMEPGRGPGLVLLDETGVARVVTGIDKGVPKMGLLDANGETRVSIFADAGVSGLTVKDQTGRDRAQLAIDTGDPFLRLYDAKEKPGAVLRVTSEASLLQLLDSGRVMGALGATQEAALLVLYARNGKAAFSAP